MKKLYCPECNSYLEGGDGEMQDCTCGWTQPEDNKVVMASLTIELNVECPYCKYNFDILEETNLNDEGDITGEIFPDGLWSKAHREFKIEDLKCPECNREFIVKQVEW